MPDCDKKAETNKNATRGERKLRDIFMNAAPGGGLLSLCWLWGDVHSLCPTPEQSW
jgi:hypothetical protein